jgi:hypothetical protein
MQAQCHYGSKAKDMRNSEAARLKNMNIHVIGAADEIRELGATASSSRSDEQGRVRGCFTRLRQRLIEIILNREPLPFDNVSRILQIE